MLPHACEASEKRTVDHSGCSMTAFSIIHAVILKKKGASSVAVCERKCERTGNVVLKQDNG